MEKAIGDESGDEHFADMAEEADNDDSNDKPVATLSAPMDDADDDGEEHFADAPDSEDESPKEAETETVVPAAKTASHFARPELSRDQRHQRGRSTRNLGRGWGL